MFGTAPGNSMPALGVVLAAGVADPPFAGCGAVIAPAACASAADNSPDVIRTSPAPSELVCGCSSLFTFSWNDCAFAAAVAGDMGFATGLGFRSTRMSVNTEIPSVATLMIRCHVMGHLRPLPRWYPHQG